MKKYIAAAVIFLCLLVSACGGSGKGSETGDKPESLHNSDPEKFIYEEKNGELPEVEPSAISEDDFNELMGMLKKQKNPGNGGF